MLITAQRMQFNIVRVRLDQCFKFNMMVCEQTNALVVFRFIGQFWGNIENNQIIRRNTKQKRLGLSSRGDVEMVKRDYVPEGLQVYR